MILQDEALDAILARAEQVVLEEDADGNIACVGSVGGSVPAVCIVDDDSDDDTVAVAPLAPELTAATSAQPRLLAQPLSAKHSAIQDFIRRERLARSGEGPVVAVQPTTSPPRQAEASVRPSPALRSPSPTLESPRKVARTSPSTSSSISTSSSSSSPALQPSVRAVAPSPPATARQPSRTAATRSVSGAPGAVGRGHFAQQSLLAWINGKSPA